MSCWKLANPLVTLPGLLREPSEPAPVCIRTLYNKLTLTHAFDEQRLDESLQQKQAELDGRPSRITVSGQSYVARVMASLPSQTRGSGRVRPGSRQRLFEASTSSRLGIGRIFTQLRRRAKASMLQVKCFLLPTSTASRALQLLVLRIPLGPTQRPKRLPHVHPDRLTGCLTFCTSKSRSTRQSSGLWASHPVTASLRSLSHQARVSDSSHSLSAFSSTPLRLDLHATTSLAAAFPQIRDTSLLH